MGLDQVCLTSFYWFLNSTEIYKLKECAEHINIVQDLVITQRAIISSNGRSQITVSEVQEHSTFNYA